MQEVEEKISLICTSIKTIHNILWSCFIWLKLNIGQMKKGSKILWNHIKYLHVLKGGFSGQSLQVVVFGRCSAAPAAVVTQSDDLHADILRKATTLLDQQFVESVCLLPQWDSVRDVSDQCVRLQLKRRLGSPLSLPLLHGGPVEDVPHACCLLLEELAVLSAVLGPGRVKRCGVLVHQVSVLGASRTAKVFDLMEAEEP